MGYLMNELYEKTIEIDGKIYRYDPDFDCYYRVPVKLSTFDRYAWIVCIVLLTGICVYLEFFK